MCNLCGESAEVCECSEDTEMDKFKKCEDCDGTGKLCMTHDCPVGDTRGIECDVIRNRRKESSTTPS